MANVSKSQIKVKLAHLLKAKEENIAVFGLKTKFGGGRSSGFATIYDSADLRKKYDSKKMLRRVSSSLSLFDLILYIRTASSLELSLQESKERKSRAE